MGVVAKEHVHLRRVDDAFRFRRHDPARNSYSTAEFVVPAGKALMVTDLSIRGFDLPLTLANARVRLIVNSGVRTTVYRTTARRDGNGHAHVRGSLISGIVVGSGTVLETDVTATEDVRGFVSGYFVVAR